MRGLRILAAGGLATAILSQPGIADAITLPDLGSSCSTTNGNNGCFKILNNFNFTSPTGQNNSAVGTAIVSQAVGSGTAIKGFTSGTGSGVMGVSGSAATAVFGISTSSGIGVAGTSATGTGISGVSNASSGTGVAGTANGTATTSRGVSGSSPNGFGVVGSTTGSSTGPTPGLSGPAGVFATSSNGHGLLAITNRDSSAAAAVYGYTSTFGAVGVVGHQAGNDSGTGVLGKVTDSAGNLISNGFAVQGLGGGISIYGHNDVGGTGVFGHSNSNNGIIGETWATSGGIAGVVGSIVSNADESCAAIYGDAGASWTVWAGNYNGDVQARGFYSTSDARLKKEIKDATYGLPEVLKLRPVTYKWKAGADHPAQNGLIAQEVRKIFPTSVRGNEKTGTLSVDYISLLPVTIKAIQQQQAQIAQQQSLIQRQEARIADLERRSTPLASSILSVSGLGGWAALGLLPVGLVIGRLRRRRTGSGETR